MIIVKLYAEVLLIFPNYSELKSSIVKCLEYVLTIGLLDGEYIYILSKANLMESALLVEVHLFSIAQSAGAKEHTDYISAEK